MSPEFSTIMARFQAEDGTLSGPALSLPVEITAEQLELVINQILGNVSFSFERVLIIRMKNFLMLSKLKMLRLSNL